jgi:hypothetical protein
MATPELNAMDHLWQHVKRDMLSNRPICSIDASADVAYQYLLDLSPQKYLLVGIMQHLCDMTCSNILSTILPKYRFLM